MRPCRRYRVKGAAPPGPAGEVGLRRSALMPNIGLQSGPVRAQKKGSNDVSTRSIDDRRRSAGRAAAGRVRWRRGHCRRRQRRAGQAGRHVLGRRGQGGSVRELRQRLPGGEPQRLHRADQHSRRRLQQQAAGDDRGRHAAGRDQHQQLPDAGTGRHAGGVDRQDGRPRLLRSAARPLPGLVHHALLGRLLRPRRKAVPGAAGHRHHHPGLQPAPVRRGRASVIPAPTGPGKASFRRRPGSCRSRRTSGAPTASTAVVSASPAPCRRRGAVP